MAKTLQGIPQLLWAEKPCSLIGALEAALSFLGEPVDYRYLMGASAAAFRIKFHERWCVSSGFIPHPDERYDGLACRAAGYRGEYDGKGNKERRELIEASIDDGRPVLAQNLGGACDWGVIVGYEGKKLLSRNYMQPEAEYTEATDFPYLIVTLEKLDEKPSDREILESSLAYAVEMFDTPEIDTHLGTYYHGRRAYDFWIHGLKDKGMFAIDDESELQAYAKTNSWVYRNLVDSRRAALWFVEEFNGRVFDGGNENLSAAAECLGMLVEELDACAFFFPEDVGAGGEGNGAGADDGERVLPKVGVWDQKLRSRAANLLSTAKDLDEVIFASLARVCGRAGVSRGSSSS